MRVWMIAALAALCTMAVPAQAQQSTTTPTAAATPAQVSAARELLTAYLIESGSVEASVQTAFTRMGPQLRANIEAESFFQSATPAHKQAAYAFLDGLPAEFAREMQARLPAVVDAAAPRIAALFQPEHARAIAAHSRTPVGHKFFLRDVVQGASETAGTAQPAIVFTADEQATQDAFLATPAGQSLTANNDALATIMAESLRDGFAALAPILRTRIITGVCTALENECPQHLR